LTLRRYLVTAENPGVMEVGFMNSTRKCVLFCKRSKKIVPREKYSRFAIKIKERQPENWLKVNCHILFELTALMS
jgi:hypothetical protein